MVAVPVSLGISCSAPAHLAVRDTAQNESRNVYALGIEKPVWRNPHIWGITAIMGILTVCYYLSSVLAFMNLTLANGLLFDVPHDLHRNLFFVPVFYAAYKFRVNGVIATVSISTILFIPRALLESPYPVSLFRTIVFVIILGFSGFLFATSLTSIEERKRLEAKIKETERVAVFQDASGLLGNDLRNPLQTIIASINLTEEKLNSMPDVEKRKVQKCVKSIKEQVWYMNKIVTDLQDYARPLKPELEDVKVSRLISESLSEIKIPKGIEVSASIPEDLLVNVDFLLMRRVFVNLILNAVQAMPNGGRLTLDAYTTTSATYINVKDTGVGIPEEYLQKIFEPLFTLKAQGLGLGLPVCKRLVELNDGELLVRSKIGKGSLFAVRLLNKKREGD